MMSLQEERDMNDELTRRKEKDCELKGKKENEL
jgi:hypothetical protein